MKKGALDYIAKPFSAEDLLNKVDARWSQQEQEGINSLQRQLKKNEKDGGHSGAWLISWSRLDEEGRVIEVNRASRSPSA